MSQSASLAGAMRAIDRPRRRVAAQLAAGRQQIGEDAGSWAAATRAIDQQGLGRAADAGAPHLGVEHDRARLGGIGGAVDIGVAEPFEMGEDRECGSRAAPARSARARRAAR